MKHIHKVAVLGAGTMGARIAAHFANAGVPSFLFDIVPPDADVPARNKIAAAGLAEIAEATGARGIRSNPLANFHGVYAVPYFGNFGGELVAQNKRASNCLCAAMAILVVVQVRPADSSAAAAEQDHSRKEFRAAILLHTDVSRAIEQGGFH